MKAVFNWFETRIDPYPAAEPEQPPATLLAFCLHYLRGAKKWLLLMSFTSASMALFEIVVFSFIGSIVDWLAIADRATFLATDGDRLVLMGVFLLVILPIMSFLNNATIGQMLLGNLPQRIRWMAHRYLLRQSMGYFQNEFAGRIGAKLMQTALAVREVVMKLSDVVIYVGCYFVGAVVLSASNDWRLALPFIAWLAVYVVLLRYFVPRIGKLAEKQADAQSSMTGRIIDSYTNIATVKLFSHSNREEAYAREALHRFLDSVHRQMRYFTVLNVSITLMNSTLLALVGGLGIWFWMLGQMTPGAIAVSVALVMRFTGMSQWVMWEMTQLFENIGTVRDGISSISLPRVVADQPGARPIGTVRGDILFDDVSFHYGKESGVIEGFGLHVKPGEKIGLVGRSGSGKSTIVSLLLRFYDRESGQILIDGADIASVTQDSLRAQVGVVTQDTSLLHRSVRENILYGRPEASEADMRDAARLAEADGFIETLEDADGRKGYDAHVGERGVKLSGGQRQRIAIARVLLKNAPILVLDEATSALDSEVEAAIQGQLQLLMANKTVIAIAHRLSTIAMLDRLVVIDGGRVAEQGTHAELLARGGIYAKLWQRQSGGFLIPDFAEEAAE